MLLTSFASVQESQSVLPAKNYVVALENELVRVVRVRYAPHEKLAVHDHSKLPTIYVYLSDSGPVRFTHVEEKPFTLVRPPKKFGTFRVSPGRIERHEVENLGETPSHFLRVELKRLPLGDQGLALRQDTLADLSKTKKVIEFESHQIAVQRIIVTGKNEEEKIEAGSASLWIALAPLQMRVTRKPRSFLTTMGCGDLYWMQAGESAAIHIVDGSTAQALRIVFATTKQ